MTYWRTLPIMGVAAAAALAAWPGEAGTLGPDAAACSQPGQPAVLARVSGFRTGSGNLRVQAYPATRADFLEKGHWLRRIDLAVAGRDVMDVCLRLPAPGAYAIAVRHDVDGNGRSGWNDGGGFSRNPRITLLRLRPRVEDVAIDVPEGLARTHVVLNYRRGLSIGPIRR